jgi:hemolysin-activating ACP:hemolysin acyltransferase
MDKYIPRQMFSVWAKVDDKTLNKLLYEDHQITNNEWNNGGNIFVLEYICPFKNLLL